MKTCALCGETAEASAETCASCGEGTWLTALEQATTTASGEPVFVPAEPTISQRPTPAEPSPPQSKRKGR